jgi:hypothetical protein
MGDANEEKKTSFSIDGAVIMRMAKHLERAFVLEATLNLVAGAEFLKQKTPSHFHINQDEYLQVQEGRLSLGDARKGECLDKGESRAYYSGGGKAWGVSVTLKILVV